MKNNIKLLNKDCIEVMSAMAEKGFKVDCIVTDPPYLYLNHKLDRSFDERLFFELASKITDKIVFFGRGDSFYKWNLLCAEFGFEFKEEIVWNKKQISNPMGKLMRVHETISVRCKKNAGINKVYINSIKKNIDNDTIENLIKDIKNVNKFISSDNFKKYVEEGIPLLEELKSKHCISLGQNFKKTSRNLSYFKTYEKGSILPSIVTENREHYKMKHPTQKPIKLMEHLVNLISSENDLVLDPFMGSGSTGVACKNLNRKFIGCEIDLEYYNIAKERLEIS